MHASTNLARRPFRNERAPWLLAGSMLVVALLVSLAQARVVMGLLSGNEAKTVLAVRAGEARVAELERDIAAEPPLKIESSELARLRAYKELVDLRVFPWRRFLGEIEQILSPNVRLTRIAPSGPQGGQGMLIELVGEARTKDAAFTLAESLDASPHFSNAVLKSLSQEEDTTRFDLEVVFHASASASRSARAGRTP